MPRQIVVLNRAAVVVVEPLESEWSGGIKGRGGHVWLSVALLLLPPHRHQQMTSVLHKHHARLWPGRMMPLLLTLMGGVGAGAGGTRHFSGRRSDKSSICGGVSARVQWAVSSKVTAADGESRHGRWRREGINVVL